MFSVILAFGASCILEINVNKSTLQTFSSIMALVNGTLKVSIIFTIVSTIILSLPRLKGQIIHLTLHCTGSEITGFVRGGAFRRHLVEDASGGNFWGQIH